ncbi:MAG TPA: FAD-binding oxidoreductase [Candidatus Acidoferrum sp.]|nr:FAD-binding oxidoreductase [Candidatus Acidoferrum sp.]
MAQPLRWQVGTVTEIHPETARAKTFTIALPEWMVHRAGMHYDIRLTAPDGYQAERSYSIASEPEIKGQIDLTVELIPDGEVSPYLHEVVMKGDHLELRGPIGGYFVWDVGLGGPLLLVGGGSGVVPLMAMIRHRVAVDSVIPTRLLYSIRTPEDVFYATELQELNARGEGFELIQTFTRQAPSGWTGYRRRIDREMLSEVIKPFGAGGVHAYICGPTLLVEAVANTLLDLGVPTQRILAERFGPTGT